MCAVNGCEEIVGNKLMCPAHWRLVPKDQQGAVERTWQRVNDREPGQPDAEFRERMAAYRTARAAAVKSAEAAVA